MDMTGGVLYFGDKPIGKVQQVSLDTLDDSFADEVVIKGSCVKTLEGSLDIYLNQKALLSLMIGRPVTNNWLKLHGGIMTRKGAKKHAI